jgi:hypothetical protein
MASMAARRYLYEMREVLVSSWQPPPGELGPLSFVLFFRIDESGGLTQVHSETPDDPIHASAIAAFQEAAPFGTVPAEARCLTEEPFEMHFTIGSP